MATVVLCFLMSYLVIVLYKDKVTNNTFCPPNIQMLITKKNLLFCTAKEYLFNFIVYTFVVVGICSVMFVMDTLFFMI